MDKHNSDLQCFEKLYPEPIEILFKWLKKYKSVFVHIKQYKIHKKQLSYNSVIHCNYILERFFNIFNTEIFFYIETRTPYTWDDLFLNVQKHLDNLHIYMNENDIVKATNILHTSLPSI